MRSLALAPLAAIVSIAGCGISVNWDGPTVAGSGNIISKYRTLADFNRIDVGGDFDVEVKVGEAQSIRLTGDDNLLPLVETKVRGGELEIDYDGSYRSRDDIKIAITVPRLSGIHSSGSSDVNVTGVRSAAFDAVVSGSSDLWVEGDFGDLDASVSGSGEITMDGTADDVDANVSGSGELDLFSVPARTARVVVTGSGEVGLDVKEDLRATVTGSGDVHYTGDPSVSSRITGSGSVHGT
jgi:hypothetical protein